MPKYIIKSRGRPKKLRKVQNSPRIDRFSPRGKPGRPEIIELEVDKFEALRLADYQGLSQKEAAKSMQISQQTFSRILKRARKLVAEAIVGGKIIIIQGGSIVCAEAAQPTNKTNQKARTPI